MIQTKKQKVYSEKANNKAHADRNSRPKSALMKSQLVSGFGLSPVNYRQHPQSIQLQKQKYLKWKNEDQMEHLLKTAMKQNHFQFYQM